MTEHLPREEFLLRYIQGDAPIRATLFPEFLQTLKALSAAPDDASSAWVWASRAVSPLLDYSSLMKLRRFLLPGLAESHHAKRIRLAVLGGPTTVQLRELIEVFLAGEGISVEIYEADYGLFRQEILTPGSGLDRFKPQIIFIATSMRDVARYPSLQQDETDVEKLAEEELANWVRLWEHAQDSWNATVIQNNFEIPPSNTLGHYSLRHSASRENYLRRLNRLFAQRAPSHVVLHDLHDLASEMGARSWYDSRFYFEFKMPCGADCLPVYAHSVVCLLRAIQGASKKVLVLDLDNTLWGGVVGDLGPGGIRLGQGSGEGEAFLAFQKYAKELQQRGILLAVCSKNDEAKAREPFEQRPDMILKLSDFACFIANWNNKADNLRILAERIDLKLDSFVFVDDNPAERALVRRLAPEVSVPELPEDPAGYVQAVACHRFFETVSFTKEDASRSEMYAQNSRRREMAASASDLDSFLASLAMRMRVEPVNELNIERVTQLVNKSNQFNLTTRRYTLAQVRERIANPAWHTLTLSLQDNLGDNGLISVILTHKHNDSLVIDTWVMSCRVLQRGVEEFARNELVELARHAGCSRIRGTYVPTAKNGMVKDHYAGLGYASDGADGEHTFWCLHVTEGLVELPHYIQREACRE